MPNTHLSIPGYHGTLEDRAESIVANGFNQSNKVIEWLGFGVYFFDNFENAKLWAIQERKRFDAESRPVVLVVEIQTEIDSFLDLDEQQTLRSFKEELKKGYKMMFGDKRGGAPNFKDNREQRCFWCNYYIRTHPNIKVIALTFPRIQYDRFGFPAVYEKRQLCVTDNTCIRMPPERLEAVQ